MPLEVPWLCKTSAFRLSTIRSSRPSPSQSARASVRLPLAPAVPTFKRSRRQVRPGQVARVECRDRLAPEHSSARLDPRKAVGAGLALLFEQGEITLVIEHHQICPAVAGPVADRGSGPPLGCQLSRRGVPPRPCRLRRGCSRRPGHSDRPGRLQPGTHARAHVAKPDDLAPDRVDDNVKITIAIPVGHARLRVAPFRLARPLDRPGRAPP